MNTRCRLAGALALVTASAGSGAACTQPPAATVVHQHRLDARLPSGSEAATEPPTSLGLRSTPTTVVASPPVRTQAPPGAVPNAAAAPAPSGTTTASWYGAESGSRTADGSAFDGSQLVFAHRSMAFGTRVRFCGPLGCVVARCADRGPWVAGRSFDLSQAAFTAAAPLSAGVATMTWAVVG